jgi:hypothetical protein
MNKNIMRDVCVISIEMTNSAFKNNPEGKELARILTELAAQVRENKIERMNYIHDINGNIVGTISL